MRDFRPGTLSGRGEFAHRQPSVWLSMVEQQGELVVTVRDDGSGSATLNTGDALPGLRDRLVALGGTLDVVSGDGGTTLTGKIPCM